jgi:hypothetical protein
MAQDLLGKSHFKTDKKNLQFYYMMPSSHPNKDLAGNLNGETWSHCVNDGL